MGSFSQCQFAMINYINDPIFESINHFIPDSGWSSAAVAQAIPIFDIDYALTLSGNGQLVWSSQLEENIDLSRLELWTRRLIGDSYTTEQLSAAAATPNLGLGLMNQIGSASGTTAIVWGEYPDNPSICALKIRVDPGSKIWSPTQTLTPATLCSSRKGPVVQLSIDAQENVHAAWIQNQTSDSSTGLWSSVYDAKSGIWAAPKPVPTPITGTAIESGGLLALASNAKGDSVITWITSGSNADSLEVIASYQPALK
jgi:hypothetical protein